MGEFIQKQAKKRYTLGIVYEPDTVDAQDDYADAETIEQAAWNYAKRLQGDRKLTEKALDTLQAIRKALETGSGRIEITDLVKASGPLGDQHTAWSDTLGDIVESYVAPADMVIDGQTIKMGTWLLGVVWSPEQFAKIERGERTGLSLGGKAKRI